jgi:hypothetical protein
MKNVRGIFKPIMSHWAHLIMTVRPTREGGLSVTLDIYSDASPTTQVPFVQQVIASAQGKSFASARKNVRRNLKNNPMYKWLLKHLPKD